MPTFREAIVVFDAKATAGAIVNRKTGKPSPFPASRRGPVLSNVAAAVRHAVQALNGGRLLGEAELLDVELEPLWLVLAHHVEADARENERSDPKKEASNVRLFVSAVTGRDVARDPQPVTEARVPEAFRVLYDAVVRAGERGELKSSTCRSYRRGVLKFAELMLAHGVGGPEATPDDAERIHAWGAALGWPRQDTAYALTAYRRAADLAGAAHLPRAYEMVNADGHGIRSLPDHAERLAAAGLTDDPRTVSMFAAVRALAPDLGDALETVVAAGRASGRSKAWAEAREHMASWVVATLLRSNIDVHVPTLTWLDLWVERRGVAVSVNAAQARQHARYLGNGAAGGASLQSVERRSLMRLLLDASAARSYANSPLTLANPDYEKDVVPVYTEKMVQHLESAWMVTYEFFGRELQKEAPELWARARAEYEAIQQHIADYNRPRLLKGRKGKDRLPATWPQVMCMGVPFLARECYAIRGEMRDRLARAGSLDSRDSQQMVSRYCDAVRDYVVVALLTDDGLRIKNYAGAMANEQITPTPKRTRGGEWVGFEKVMSRWSGLDHEDVRLKVAEKSGEANSRAREVTPAFLDLVLFWDYWTLARPRALVAAGLLGTVDEYDPTTDSWAVFPTPRPKPHQVARYHTERAAYDRDIERVTTGDDGARPVSPAWRGNMTEDSLSDIYGAALHRICVEVLGRDLPPYGSPELAKEWRGLFGAHISRTKIACYFGGIRGDWARAEWLTNDRELTLRRHYARLQQSFDQVRSRRDWECPTWFDALVDRALERHPGDDWAAVWRDLGPMRPGDALRLLDGVPDLPRRVRARSGQA